MVFTHPPSPKSANFGVSSRREGWIPPECRDQRAVHLLVAFSPSSFDHLLLSGTPRYATAPGTDIPEESGIPPSITLQGAEQMGFSSQGCAEEAGEQSLCILQEEDHEGCAYTAWSLHAKDAPTTSTHLQLPVEQGRKQEVLLRPGWKGSDGGTTHTLL